MTEIPTPDREHDKALVPVTQEDRDFAGDLWRDELCMETPHENDGVAAALLEAIAIRAARHRLATRSQGDGPTDAAGVLSLLREARPYLEPARLREQAAAIEGTLDRMPVRSLARNIDAALTRPLAPEAASVGVEAFLQGVEYAARRVRSWINPPVPNAIASALMIDVDNGISADVPTLEYVADTLEAYVAKRGRAALAQHPTAPTAPENTEK